MQHTAPQNFHGKLLWLSAPHLGTFCFQLWSTLKQHGLRAAFVNHSSVVRCHLCPIWPHVFPQILPYIFWTCPTRAYHVPRTKCHSHDPSKSEALSRFRNTSLRWRVPSPTPNPWAAGPRLVGCPRLLIQCIPSWRTRHVLSVPSFSLTKTRPVRAEKQSEPSKSLSVLDLFIVRNSKY
jgi:hypothetical protein